jgi:23S rRNA (pseudouridine1915-N3)-methyltransferase
VRILVLAVGRLKEAYWTDAEAEYRKRLPRYADVDVREVKDEAALLAAVPARARLVLLDERGDNLSSEDIAQKILARAQADAVPLAFGIGGADGFSSEARKQAARLLAFGKITLPHRLCRVILLEQIYRGLTLLRGEPYHRS